MYKLLVLDIDDTLAPSGAKVIPQQNLDALRRAHDAGIKVTIATGRGYLASSYIWKQLELKGPVINYGGAVIMDTRTDTPIYTTSIPNALTQELLAQAADMGIHAHIYQGDAVVYEKLTDYGKAYCARLNLPAVLEPELRQKAWDNVPKVLFITTKERAAELIPQFQKQYAGRLKVSGSSAGFIEFNHPAAHKGSATAKVAEYFGIKQAETVAVGDNSLDKEMIQWAGLGCAVGDAQADILACADLVLPKCGDMAIAHLVDNILLKG